MTLEGRHRNGHYRWDTQYQSVQMVAYLLFLFSRVILFYSSRTSYSFVVLVCWDTMRKDMDALVAKWVDAGKPEPGEKSKVLEIEKIEDKD